jgi:hypothetical protein
VLAAVAFATVSFAQSGSGATLDTTVAPANAGTKSKPKNTTFTMNIVNQDTFKTMSELDVYLAKNVKFNLKGMPSCSNAKITAETCPKSTLLGTGEAKAKVGVNGPVEDIGDRTFKVKAYKTPHPKTGKAMLGFYIDDGMFKFLANTTLTAASGKYGQRLHIEVPLLAQYVGDPNSGNVTYNGLVSLYAKLTKKVGSKYLVSTVGCANKKHPYRTVLTFIDNTVRPKGTAEATDTAPCTK